MKATLYSHLESLLTLIPDSPRAIVRSSFGKLFSLVALTLAGSGAVRADDDLVIDGVARSIPGGAYRTVVVKNNGSLTVNGTLAAQEIYVATGVLTTTENIECALLNVNGTVAITKSLICTSAVFYSGNSSVFGTNNYVDTLDIQGSLTTLGTWKVRQLTLRTGSTLSIRAADGSYPKSGTLTILSDTTTIEQGGRIDATGSGNDPRGQGQDWYASETGGSHAGQGGRGYVNSSGDGQRPPYGSPIIYEASMGGAAGAARGLNYGGGSVQIEAESSLNVVGDIIADGLNGPRSDFGGGAGGSILLRSPSIVLRGALLARGGNGGIDGGGGGGGGYIKVFYDTLDADPAALSNIVSRAYVAGGARGGYLNTQNGGAGRSYFDHMPKVESLIAPAANAAEPNGIVTFRLGLLDSSGSLDGHTDSITPRIELSTNGFSTVAYAFDQGEVLTGWNRVLFYSGNTAEFTTPTPLPTGVYQWRVTLRDQSLWSRYTVPRTFTIGGAVPNSPLTQEMLLTPTIKITGAVGTRCAIEYTEDFGSNGVWRTLSIVTLHSSPQMYFGLCSRICG